MDSGVIRIRVPKKKAAVEDLEVKQPMEFKAEQIMAMDDDQMLYHFQRITGMSCLSCSHCHSCLVPLAKFVYAIRKRCEKKGLSATMAIPKTCDKQLKKNEWWRLDKSSRLESPQLRELRMWHESQLKNPVPKEKRVEIEAEYQRLRKAAIEAEYERRMTMMREDN